MGARASSIGPTTLAMLAVAASLAAGGLARALPASRVFSSPTQRIAAFDPPTGWDRAATPPSARLLATWAHREGGRLTLVADRVASGVDAGALLDQSRASLEKQGWTISHVDRGAQRPVATAPDASGGRVLVEATIERGRRVARQLYLVEAGYGYVLTMVVPVEQIEARGHEFEQAIVSLKLGDAASR